LYIYIRGFTRINNFKRKEMKELEEKIMAEVLHIIHDHEYSLVKVRETIKECLDNAYAKGYNTGSIAQYNESHE
jgi:hypothetical protein